MLNPATTTRIFKTVTSLIIMFSAALIVCGGSVQAAANQVVWTGATSSDFEVGTNWQGGVVPTDDTTTDIAVFSSTPVTANQPTLTKNRSVGGLLFSTPQGGWTLGGNFTMTLGTSGLSSAGQTAGTNTITCNLSLSAAQSWAVGAAGTVLMKGVMTSAPGSLISYGDVTNTGLLSFTNHGNSGFLGGMTINFGIVAASDGNNQSSPLGQGPYIINGISAGNGGFLRSDAFDSFGYSGGGPSSITVNQGGAVTTNGGGFRTTIGSMPAFILNGGTVMDGGNGNNGDGVFSIQFGAINVPDNAAAVSTISTRIGLNRMERTLLALVPERLVASTWICRLQAPRLLSLEITVQHSLKTVLASCFWEVRAPLPAARNLTLALFGWPRPRRSTSATAD